MRLARDSATKFPGIGPWVPSCRDSQSHSQGFLRHTVRCHIPALSKSEIPVSQSQISRDLLSSAILRSAAAVH